MGIIRAVTFLTALLNLFCCVSFSAVQVNIPPCPSATERVYYPSEDKPLWIACRSTDGHYQSWLLQLSNQGELVRIAHVQNSLRHGKEIRAGETGTYEERHFSNGHLDGTSYLFRSPASLHQIHPKPIPTADWNAFKPGSNASLFQTWSKLEPFSIIDFDRGRIARLRATRTEEEPRTGKTQTLKTDYRFETRPDGRIFALNHPEMKNLFFVDPEALWVLNGPDLKSALIPGFGSCKQYSGPVGRLGRHYDSLLYRRETTEAKHVQKLKEIRDRFVRFCVPQDLMEHLGVIECPPHLPSPRAPTPCFLALSDQVKLPYQPKFFKFDLSRNLPPHELQSLFLKRGLQKFINQYDVVSETLDLVGDGQEKNKVVVKKTARGIRWKPFKKEDASSGEDSDWWLWQGIPGY